MQNLSTTTTARHFAQTYRPDIDGLRALAVIAVVFCHAQLAGFSGGFVGVDVFFVISGYVVTSSIVRDLEAGTFSFGQFYVRRARRLVPALFVMLASVLIFSILLRVPSDAYEVAKAIGYNTILAANIYLSKGWNYFAPRAEDQPLLHTWSLSVEEQFYLLFPPVLALLFRHRGRSVTWGVLAGLFAASAVISEVHVRNGSAGSYYLFQNRAFELLIGVLIALASFKKGAGRAHRFIGDVGFILGITLVAFCVVRFDAKTPFPGWHALVPCAGAALVIASGARSRLARLLLANRAAVMIGKLSYSIYLWHWPIFFALRTFGLTEPIDLVAGIGISLLVSGLSYWLVERPLRVRRISKRKAVIGFMIAPVLFSGAVVAVGKTTDGFIFAYPKAIGTDYALAGHTVFDLPRGKKCFSQTYATDAKDCSVGAVRSKNKAVLWGDSHSYQLIDFFDDLGKKYDLSIHDLGFAMCPPIETMPPLPGDKSLMTPHLECVAHDKAVMAYLFAHPEVKTVFMEAVWSLYSNGEPRPGATVQAHGFMPLQIDRELANTITKLQRAGKRVIMLDDVPTIPPELVNCEFYRDGWIHPRTQVCEYPASFNTANRQVISRILSRLTTKFPDVAVIHTFDVLCGAHVCKMELDGAPLYRYGDSGHLGLAGSQMYFAEYQEKHPLELTTILGPEKHP